MCGQCSVPELNLALLTVNFDCPQVPRTIGFIIFKVNTIISVIAPGAVSKYKTDQNIYELR